MEFVILGTQVVETSYSYTPTSQREKMDIETSTSCRIMRSPLHPRAIMIETSVVSKSNTGNLNFSLKTISNIELKIDMSDAEINNSCLPLVLTAVNEIMKSLTGCISAPRLEMPPIQIVIENMFGVKR